MSPTRLNNQLQQTISQLSENSPLHGLSLEHRDGDPLPSQQALAEVVDLCRSVFFFCGGDLSFTSAITYDFELWSAAQQRWLEISSVSNFETYQSNRLHLRYRDENGKTQLAHTLNGSSLALPRVVAALLEDNQTPEGIIIPDILRPYTGFDKID